MPQIVFPHANGYSVELVDFVAAWISLVEQFGPEHCSDPLTASMPRRPSRDPLSGVISRGHCFSAEYLCRVVVPSGYRNAGQATNPFLTRNKNFLNVFNRVDPLTGRTLSHVALSAAAKRVWGRAADRDAELGHAEALFELADDAVKPAHIRQNAPTAGCPQISLHSVVKAFVAQVDANPYQPMYRGQPVRGMGPVMGWTARLGAYFWPKPSIGAAATNSHLAPIRRDLEILAKDCAAGKQWNRTQRALAVARANDVFKWGGVPQDRRAVTWENVWAVMENALTGCASLNAPMNSGWTKVAALATEYQEALGGSTQAIWDSRVATSIIRRVDSILKTAKCRQIPQFLSGLGTVPGRGGTRPVKGLHFKWPSAYGRWEGQFAGSRFVRLIRDELNAVNRESNRRWTTRDVEMVLFGDGY